MGYNLALRFARNQRAMVTSLFKKSKQLSLYGWKLTLG